MSLLQGDDAVALVAARNGAEHADVLPLVLAVALQQSAVLRAPPVLRRTACAHLHQDVVLLGSLGVVFVQMGLAKRRIADQAGFHRWLGPIQAEVTGNHLLLPLCGALALLSFGRGGQERLHDATQLEILLQLQDGPQLELAHGAGVRGLGLLLGTERLLDALLAEAVTAAQRHRVPVQAQADGTAEFILQAGTPSKFFLSSCHGCRNGALARLRETKLKGRPWCCAPAGDPAQRLRVLPLRPLAGRQRHAPRPCKQLLSALAATLDVCPLSQAASLCV